MRRKGGIYAFSADHAIAREAYGPYLESPWLEIYLDQGATPRKGNPPVCRRVAWGAADRELAPAPHGRHRWRHSRYHRLQRGRPPPHTRLLGRTDGDTMTNGSGSNAIARSNAPAR